MAVFRVEKTKDFTVMSNHHLRNSILCLVNPPIGEGSRCQGFSARTKILDSGCSPRYNAGGKVCGKKAEKVEPPPITPDDFKYQRFDIRLFLDDFISSGFDFTFPVSYIKRAGTDISM